MRASSSHVPWLRTAIESDSSTPDGNCTTSCTSARGGVHCTPTQISASASACRAYAGVARPAALMRSASASGSSCRPAQSATGPLQISTRSRRSSRSSPGIWSAVCFLFAMKKRAAKYSAINSWRKLSTLSELISISSAPSASCKSCAISPYGKGSFSPSVNAPGCSFSPTRSTCHLAQKAHHLLLPRRLAIPCCPLTYNALPHRLAEQATARIDLLATLYADRIDHAQQCNEQHGVAALVAQAAPFDHLHNLPCGVAPLLPLIGHIGLHEAGDLLRLQGIEHDAFRTPIIDQLHQFALSAIIDHATGDNQPIRRFTRQAHQLPAHLSEVGAVNFVQSVAEQQQTPLLR